MLSCLYVPVGVDFRLRFAKAGSGRFLGMQLRNAPNEFGSSSVRSPIASASSAVRRMCILPRVGRRCIASLVRRTTNAVASSRKPSLIWVVGVCDAATTRAWPLSISIIVTPRPRVSTSLAVRDALGLQYSQSLLSAISYVPTAIKRSPAASSLLRTHSSTLLYNRDELHLGKPRLTLDQFEDVPDFGRAEDEQRGAALLQYDGINEHQPLCVAGLATYAYTQNRGSCVRTSCIAPRRRKRPCCCE